MTNDYLCPLPGLFVLLSNIHMKHINTQVCHSRFADEVLLVKHHVARPLRITLVLGRGARSSNGFPPNAQV